jgi:hypothetical protein
VTELLDDADELVGRILSPWGGLLWLSALPYALLAVHFVDRVLSLGAQAGQYGAHLAELAAATTAALVLALAGRAVFVRACALGLRSDAVPGAESLRVGLGPLLTCLYTGLGLELLFVLTAPTLLAIPILVLVTGLAAAAAPLGTRPSLAGPWTVLSRLLRHPRTLSALVLLFGGAFVVVTANLYVTFVVGVWLAQAWPGFEAGPWADVLSYKNRSFWLVLLSGAALALEPFWIGALTLYAQRVLARESGDDLRIGWARLRAGEGAAP